MDTCSLSIGLRLIIVVCSSALWLQPLPLNVSIISRLHPPVKWSITWLSCIVYHLSFHTWPLLQPWSMTWCNLSRHSPCAALEVYHSYWSLDTLSLSSCSFHIGLFGSTVFVIRTRTVMSWVSESHVLGHSHTQCQVIKPSPIVYLYYTIGRLTMSSLFCALLRFICARSHHKVLFITQRSTYVLM